MGVADIAVLVTVAGFGSFILLLLIRTTVHGLILGRIRKKYPGDWRELGNPTLFSSSSISNLQRLRQYVNGKRYEARSDRRLSGYIAVWKWSGRLGLAAFAVTILSLLFYWK